MFWTNFALSIPNGANSETVWPWGTDHVGSVAGVCGTGGEHMSHSKQYLYEWCNNYILSGKFL